MQADNVEAARPLFQQSYDLSATHHLDDHTCNAAHMIAIAAATPEEKITWNTLAIELAEHSTLPRARTWIGPLYNNLGHAYIDAKQYEKALSTLKKAQEIQ
jgi:hypothetical protein